MYEKRRTKRLMEENEIILEIVSKDNLSLNKKISYNISKDISFSGARIQTNAFLPLNTLLKIQLTLTNPPRMVTALGRVKWARAMYGDDSFNVFMTFAWYGHLRNLSHKPFIIAALVSWGIALFEYLLQVPANRVGHEVMSLGELKILQEVITLSVFVPFSILYMKEKLSLDYLWAGLCLLGAVFFLFRGRILGA